MAEEVVEAAMEVVEEVVGAAEEVVEEMVAVATVVGVMRVVAKGVEMQRVGMAEAAKEEKMGELDNRREKIHENRTNKEVNLNRRRRKAKMKRTPHQQNLTHSSHVDSSITQYT